MLEKDGNPGEGGIKKESIPEIDWNPQEHQASQILDSVMSNYQKRIYAVIGDAILAKVNDTERQKLKRRWEGICIKFFETLLVDSFSESNLGYIVHEGLVEYTDFQNILMEITKYSILEGETPEYILLLIHAHPEVFLRRNFIREDAEIQKKLQERLVVLRENQQTNTIDMVETMFLNPELS